jgi:hypothetical protein
LKTKIRGPKRKRDIDVRIFRVKAVKDNDLPTITATIDPPPNAAGWNNTNVAVKFNCSDSTSGIATCSEQVTVETEGANQVVSGTAVDKAGNQATISVKLNIDKTPPNLTPTIDPLPNSYGWNNSNVTVNFECSDMTSGIASCPVLVNVETEGADQQISGTATDRAGNKATKTVFVSLDMTPPDITVTSPVEDLEIFGYMLPYDFEVKGTVSDNLSGIATVTCNGSAASLVSDEFSYTLSLIDGPNRIVAAAVDSAGNEGIAPNLELTFIEPEIELAYVDDFNWVWWDYGGNAQSHVTLFDPIVPSGFHSFGHFAQVGWVGEPNGYMLVARELKPGALEHPLEFEHVWDSNYFGSAFGIVIWKPIPPSGYDCLGLIASLTVPSPEEVMCIRKDLTVPGTIGDGLWSNMDPSGNPFPFVAWQNIPDRKNVASEGKYGVYTGTFTGSNYESVDGSDLTNTVDKRYVKSADMAPGSVDQLVQTYGPHIYYHPLEIFFPDDPDHVLDNVELCYGIVPTESDYDAFTISSSGCTPTSAQGLKTNYDEVVKEHPLYNNPGTTDPNPNFRFWLNIGLDAVAGDISNAKAIINVLPIDVLFTDIQFWMFYPFNGPGRARVGPLGAPFSMGDDVHFTTVGRHYGDWEHVTLRFLNSTEDLIAVYMSRHSQGQWFSKNYFYDTLQFSGNHPIVYAAKYSHAFYNIAYDPIVYHITYKTVANVWLWDHTGNGYLFNAFEQDNYEIVHSGIQGVPIIKKLWLEYPGRWGQYERLAQIIDVIYPYTETEIGAGPYGPKTKDDWNYGDPDYDWHWQAEGTYE